MDEPIIESLSAEQAAARTASPAATRTAPQPAPQPAIYAEDIDERPDFSVANASVRPDAPEGDEDRKSFAKRAEETPAVTRFSSFEERYAEAQKMLTQNATVRWVLYHILEWCNEGRAVPLAELETAIAAEPGFATTRQVPYFMVSWLEQSFALDECYLDADGKVYTWEDVEPLSEDEFDDLVAQYAYVTNEVGRAALKEFSPEAGVRGLINLHPDRRDLYLDVLEYCIQTRNFAQVERRIRQSDAFARVRETNPDITPSVFIDKLSGAGSLSYEDGWKTTKEGTELLKHLKEEV